MTQRPVELSRFLAATQAAMRARTADGTAAAGMVARAFDALARPGSASTDNPARLPACQHLETACAPEHFSEPDLAEVVRTFGALEPLLTWRPRQGSADGANAAYPEGHANAMIAGPGGLERRSDVWLGATILAPRVRYPDHTHPPEETYLVMSPGRFGHGAEDWVAPGIGGTFYNPPGIVHRMASDAAPLFALWLLWAGEG